ncbi:MAG TPA: MerR family transcriptional regulator [Candidatus Acidoferrales bacterium]|nr:MerR family transcriptional regulator [Candidatus Acidoferrales bacterium]
MTREKVYRSGELARLAGVSTDTLRHYERIGVLVRPPRASNGYRVYSAVSLNRVLVLQSAVRAGFSLAELARILGLREHGGAPCRMVHSLARQKIRSLDQQILRLQELKAFLAKLARDWATRLRKTPPGQKAYLLDSLAGKEHPARTKGLLQKYRRKKS